MLDPLWDLDKFGQFFFNYSGCKRNEMWGRNYVRPAVGLGQILRSLCLCLSLSLSLSVITAGVRRKKCGVKALLDKFWHALGLRQIFDQSYKNTAGVTGDWCGVKLVRPSFKLRQILTIL